MDICLIVSPSTIDTFFRNYKFYKKYILNLTNSSEYFVKSVSFGSIFENFVTSKRCNGRWSQYKVYCKIVFKTYQISVALPTGFVCEWIDTSLRNRRSTLTLSSLPDLSHKLSDTRTFRRRCKWNLHPAEPGKFTEFTI